MASIRSIVALLATTFAGSLLAQERPGALPYDLAFGRSGLLRDAWPAVSGGGRYLAYEIRRAPVGIDLNDRYLPNGTPTSVAGSRIVISIDGGAPIDVCPGGSCWRPAWSADGRRIAFYSDRDGPPQLWIADRIGGKARRLATAAIKAKLWSGDEPRWSPDGATIYVPIAPDGEFHSPAAPPPEPAAANPARVTLFASGKEADSASTTAVGAQWAPMLRENLASIGAVDVVSGKLRLLVTAAGDVRPSVLRLSASGRWVSHLSVFKIGSVTSQASTLDLAVTPAAGGSTRPIVEDLPVLNDYHGANYSWHPTEDRLIYLKAGQLWLVDVAGGGAPVRLGEALGPLAPTINTFTRDGAMALVGIEPKNDGDYGDIRPRGLALIPLAGGEPISYRFDDARYKFREIVKADERTLWQPDPASVTVCLDEWATGQKVMMRFDPAHPQGTILWRGLARFGNLTGGQHDFLIGSYEDLSTPPDLYRYPADFGTRARISHIEPRLDSARVGTAEMFETTVPLADGTLGRVRTGILLPPGAKRGDRLPAVVMMYPGGDRTREAERFGGGDALTIPTLLLTSRGFAVVLADLTLGPNGRAGNPVDEMIDVLLPQLHHAAELGYVDIARLGLGGQSFGGYGTAAIVSRTNLFRGAVAISGIYDLPGTYGHLLKNGSSFFIGWNEGGQARMGTHPWANLRRYIDNSPYYQADKILTPILLVHGESDMAYHDAQKLFSALRRLDRPAVLASYAAQGHVIYEWDRPSALDAAQRIVAFFRRHLGDPR